MDFFFPGVFIRVTVSIFGVIMFLRMDWMVGNAGLGLCLLMVGISLFVSGTVSSPFFTGHTSRRQQQLRRPFAFLLCCLGDHLRERVVHQWQNDVEWSVRSCL